MVNYDHTAILLGANDSIRRAIEVIDTGRIQIALVADEQGCLLGTVTDGDIRRGLLKGIGLDDAVGSIMHVNPTTAPSGTPRNELLSLMAAKSVKQIPLVDQSGLLTGVEGLDDLLSKPRTKDNVAIILAGGQGVRLRPLTNDLPKPLVRVGGIPVLERIVHRLRDHGFNRIFISINYLGEQIENHFGDGRGLGMSIQYLRESEPLGSAGPLGLLAGKLESPCLVINGDLVTEVNFEQMLTFHIKGDFDFTIGVTQYPLQIPFGEVITENELVVEFREKPTEIRLINAGVYVLNPNVASLVPKDEYHGMNQLMDQLLSDHDSQIGAFPIHEYWKDIGTHSEHQQAQQDYRLN